MTVQLEGDRIRIAGPGVIEDAELLLTLLQADPTRIVDLTEAGHLHAAFVQILLALRPALAGPARDPFVQKWLMPLLTPGASG
jgi:hypothetical protein